MDVHLLMDAMRANDRGGGLAGFVLTAVLCVFFIAGCKPGENFRPQADPIEFTVPTGEISARAPLQLGFSPSVPRDGLTVRVEDASGRAIFGVTTTTADGEAPDLVSSAIFAPAYSFTVGQEHTLAIETLVGMSETTFTATSALQFQPGVYLFVATVPGLEELNPALLTFFVEFRALVPATGAFEMIFMDADDALSANSTDFLCEIDGVPFAADPVQQGADIGFTFFADGAVQVVGSGDDARLGEFFSTDPFDLIVAPLASIDGLEFVNQTVPTAGGASGVLLAEGIFLGTGATRVFVGGVANYRMAFCPDVDTLPAPPRPPVVAEQ